MAACLMVSLSGLTDDLVGATRLTVELAARGVPLSLLLRPSGPDGPVRAGSALAGWVHERRDAGDAVVLHGFDHAPDPTAAKLRLAMGRRAEFAALPRHEAGLRLTAARRALTAIGLRTEVFAAPRWLTSPGTVEALGEQGFAVLADEVGVRRLDAAGTRVRGRVLGLPGRVGGEARAARLLTAEAVRAARRGAAVRIDVGPADLARPWRRGAVLAAVDSALASGAHPTTYRLRALAPTAAVA